MILKWKASFSRLISTASLTKKEVIQTGRTVIIANVMGMGLGTSLLFSCEIETENLSALMTEFKEVPVQSSATDFAMTNLHSLQKQGAKHSRIHGLKFSIIGLASASQLKNSATQRQDSFRNLKVWVFHSTPWIPPSLNPLKLFTVQTSSPDAEPQTFHEVPSWHPLFDPFESNSNNSRSMC